MLFYRPDLGNTDTLSIGGMQEPPPIQIWTEEDITKLQACSILFLSLGEHTYPCSSFSRQSYDTPTTGGPSKQTEILDKRLDRSYEGE
jgi:hypothetical protein